MKYRSRRILSLPIATLSVLFVSVILFGGTAHAQDAMSLNDQQSIIQQQTQSVESKNLSLATAAQEAKTLAQQKIVLSTQLEQETKSIGELKQKVDEKRAAAEAEKKRLEAIKNMFVHITLYASNSAGNTYAPGNCTWYAKSRRPDLPNNLGNANTWYSTAASLGWNVGSTPKKGAVATTTAGWAGHVAYVEGVSLDSQWVTISEMNYGGLYNMNTRTVHFSEFNYIYELQ